MYAMRGIISINRTGKYVSPSAPGGPNIPAESGAGTYSGKVVLIASPNDNPASYAVISLQDYVAGVRSTPVYAILYSFLRTSVVNQITTDEYRVDYVGRVTGVSDEFAAADGRVVRTFDFCGLWKTGQGAIDTWKLLGENDGKVVSRNLEYGDVAQLLTEDRTSYFRPANDVILSDDSGLYPIDGSLYTSSKWGLKAAITDPMSRAIEVIQWSGVRADGTVDLLGEYPTARFGKGLLAASPTLNLDRNVLQFNERSNDRAVYVNLFDFASPVAIDPTTQDLYWLVFGIGGQQGSLTPYFAKTSTTPIDNTLPMLTDVCSLIPCGSLPAEKP